MFDEPRFRALLNDYFDEFLTGDERVRFEQAIRTTARARELFWEAARQHAQAREWALARAGHDLAGLVEPDDSSVIRPRHAWRRGALWFSAAAAAAIALLLFKSIPPHTPHAPRSITSSSAISPVALLALSSEAKWDVDFDPRRTGAALLPGKYRLLSGDVRIDFYSGARTWVRGPAEIEIVSDMRMTLTRGIISAEVPPVATGFCIHSPDLEVVDIGTAFGIAVHHDTTELHVFQGEIDIRHTTTPTAPPTRLTAGKAIRTTGQNWNHIPASHSSFPDGEAIIESLAGEREARYWDWQKSTEAFTRSPGILVHYLFDRQENDGIIRNVVPGARRPTDGTLIGGEWTSGRWRQKSAVSFSGPSDRIRLAVPGEYRSLTFLTWMRLDALPKELTSILRVEALAPGTLRWGIDPLGRLRLGVWTPKKNILSPVENKLVEWDLAASEPLMEQELDHWSHLAATYDADNKKIQLWLNGIRVARRDLKHGFSAKLGLCQIGSAVTDDSNLTGAKTIRGRMDEFVIVNRAFTPEEIRNHYRQGKPRNANNMADPLDW